MGGRGKPFKKGQSGNPGGRPKTDKEAIEWLNKHSRGGQKYFEIADSIADGKLLVKRTIVNNSGEFVETEDSPSHKERLAAIALLTNRQMGTPKASTEISGPDGGQLIVRVLTYGNEGESNAVPAQAPDAADE